LYVGRTSEIVVLAAVASSNRDEFRFDHPSEVDVSRKNARHLAFGHGVSELSNERERLWSR
jgi:hypothetical protein